MSIQRVTLDSYEAYCQYVENMNNDSPITIFYFSGEKLPSGQSWCSDCVEAEPVVEAYLSQCRLSLTFVHVNVGTREYWKDVECPFRTDARLRLMVIPTLVRWGSVRRLEGSQCHNRSLLDMLFSDEDD